MKKKRSMRRRSGPFGAGRGKNLNQPKAADFSRSVLSLRGDRIRGDSGKLSMAEALCRCGHPKSEHLERGCNHMDDLGPQPHGNPEGGLCTCHGFNPSPLQNRVMARPVDPRDKHIPKH
jgi:hypothetical protein